MESNSKLYLLVLYIGFLAPFLLRGLTWAMLYVWTKNYPQVVGTCSGHHGQLISQNCVLTKIRAEPPPLKKPNDNPHHINTSSDRPPQVIKQTPKTISQRLSNISCDKIEFKKVRQEYQNALTKSGHKEILKYEPKDANRKRRRKIKNHMV